MRDQRQAFIDHYVQCLNGAEAARRAGYSVHTARQQGSRLLSNADIQAEISARLAGLKMSADEVLERLAEHARGSLGDFVTVRADGDFVIDLSAAAAEHKLHLLKKLKKTVKRGDWGSETTVEIELYDAQAALVQLGKHHRLWVERVEMDWARELEAAGLNPDDVERGLVEEFERHLLAGAGSNDRVGVGEGENAGGSAPAEQPGV